MKYAFVVGPCSDTCTDFFQTWYDARHNSTLQFESSVNDFEFIQGHRQKSWNSCNHSVVEWCDVAQSFD